MTALEKTEKLPCSFGVYQKISKIKLLALDVDGVLTDGSINMGAEGEIFKAFNVKDGLGISCALRNDISIAIITGRKSPIIHNRAKELGIELLSEGVKDKYSELMRIAKELKLSREEVAYMGDDLNDLAAFRAAGIKFAPADAVHEVLAAADYISTKNGGQGAVREVIERILSSQGKWQGIVTAYSSCGQGDKQ
ncbi:MAG: HAD-IIIA family hydrolase [Phascolarctobacterium sp.]|nr:HAD-IIIA family hydrolase [Phascolarctobacterium sp.]